MRSFRPSQEPINGDWETLELEEAKSGCPAVLAYSGSLDKLLPILGPCRAPRPELSTQYKDRSQACSALLAP